MGARHRLAIVWGCLLVAGTGLAARAETTHGEPCDSACQVAEGRLKEQATDAIRQHVVGQLAKAGGLRGSMTATPAASLPTTTWWVTPNGACPVVDMSRCFDSIKAALDHVARQPLEAYPPNFPTILRRLVYVYPGTYFERAFEVPVHTILQGIDETSALNIGSSKGVSVFFKDDSEGSLITLRDSASIANMEIQAGFISMPPLMHNPQTGDVRLIHISPFGNPSYNRLTNVFMVSVFPAEDTGHAFTCMAVEGRAGAWLTVSETTTAVVGNAGARSRVLSTSGSASAAVWNSWFFPRMASIFPPMAEGVHHGSRGKMQLYSTTLYADDGSSFGTDLIQAGGYLTVQDSPYQTWRGRVKSWDHRPALLPPVLDSAPSCDGPCAYAATDGSLCWFDGRQWSNLSGSTPCDD